MRLAALLGILMVMTACGGATPSGGAGVSPGTGGDQPLPLAGRSFLSTRVTVGGADRPLAAGSRIRIGFTDGQLSLHAGCNSMGGPVRVDGGRMTLVGDGLAMTEMACAEPLMAQDSWLADLVAAGADLTLQDDRLTLVSGGTTITLQDERTAVPDLALWGTDWVLDSVVRGDTASSTSSTAGTAPTLRFEQGPPAKVLVQTGCNSGSGPVQVAGGTLTLGPVATTRRGCVDPAATATEKAILTLLDGDTAFTVRGSSLTLTRGDLSLVYRAGSTG